MGEKEPFDDPSDTHGKCPECLEKQRQESARVFAKKAKVKIKS